MVHAHVETDDVRSGHRGTVRRTGPAPAAPLDVSRDVEFGFVDRAADPKRLLNES